MIIQRIANDCLQALKSAAALFANQCIREKARAADPWARSACARPQIGPRKASDRPAPGLGSARVRPRVEKRGRGRREGGGRWEGRGGRGGVRNVPDSVGGVGPVGRPRPAIAAAAAAAAPPPLSRVRSACARPQVCQRQARGRSEPGPSPRLPPPPAAAAAAVSADVG